MLLSSPFSFLFPFLFSIFIPLLSPFFLSTFPSTPCRQRSHTRALRLLPLIIALVTRVSLIVSVITLISPSPSAVRAVCLLSFNSDVGNYVDWPHIFSFFYARGLLGMRTDMSVYLYRCIYRSKVLCLHTYIHTHKSPWMNLSVCACWTADNAHKHKYDLR